MATIKLGSIITEIAGSVGGTNFRRFRGATVMSNKSFGASANRLLGNTGLSQNVKVIQEWANLTQSVRDNWNSQALLFQFTDKFGDLKNLSGRELYIKLISQIRNTTFPDPNVNTLDSTVDVITINTGSIVEGGVAKIVMDNTYSNSCILIQVQRVKGQFQNAIYNKRQAITKENNVYTAEIEFTTNFWLKFPYAVVGDNFRIFATPVNKSGFQGLTKEIYLTVT